MARKTTARKGKGGAKRGPAAAAAAESINESGLTKGEVRKLNALRKSLGAKIAERAFTQWLRQKTSSKSAPTVDKAAATIAGTLEALTSAGKLRIPRGGYLVKRGRGRVIVTRVRGG